VPSAHDNVPGFICIDHVAVAVPAGELEKQVAAYQMMGFREVHREEVRGTDQVREVLLQVGDGASLMQLLEPMSADSPVQKLIDRNSGRGGFAHIAYRVRDIQVAFAHMRDAGFSVIDSAPRPGSRGTTVFFVHPKSPFGFLIEIVQAGADETVR
jgi:methylmalonyl-CoA/ethylmalonyl-CoA epimerase